MNIGLDIDDTITAQPEFFSMLTHSIRQLGGKVYVVSTRMNTEDVREITEEMLKSYDVVYDELFLIASIKEAEKICPYDELDSYQKWVWQKVDYCQKKAVSVFFDDDQRVVELFRLFAPEIQVFKVCKEIDDKA